MAVNNVSVQHNGEFLPDIMLLTQRYYYHRGSGLNGVMILEIESISLQIRRVSAAFVTVLNNAYVWCPFGLVRFPLRTNKNIKIPSIKNRHLRPLPRRPPPLPPPTTFPLAKHDPTRRWTSQFKAMDRLLVLKKLISEYFRQQPQNARKLTSHEWTVTNEVCSLLDDVSEATIRMQGAGDTHVSQAMFILTEVNAMLKEESHPIRVPNATFLPPPPDGIPRESTQLAELTLEAQDMREVLLEMMEDRGMGKVSLKVERLSALLDPRRKALGADQLVNGSAALWTRGRRRGLEGKVIAEFADAQTQLSGPVPAPVLDVEPAESAPKTKRLSRLEEWRETRVRAAAGGEGDSGRAEPQAAVAGRRVLIGREVLVYLAEQDQLDEDPFNLLGFGNRRGTDSVCPTTSTVTSPAEMSYLAFIARLYHGIELTSCQVERKFSALAHLIGDLRSRMLASKVERMMFIRLNRHNLIDEVRELDATVAQARARVAKSAQKYVAAQEERSNTSVDLTVYLVDTTNGHVDRIPRLPAFVQSFLGIFFVMCFVAVLWVISRYQWLSIFFCLSFLMISMPAHIHSR